jgi:hypothetical protein
VLTLDDMMSTTSTAASGPARSIDAAAAARGASRHGIYGIDASGRSCVGGAGSRAQSVT